MVKPNILILTTFPVVKGLSGSQYVVHHLYKYFASSFNVKVLSLADHTAKEDRVVITTNFENIIFPIEMEQVRLMYEQQKKIKYPQADVIQVKYWHLNNKYVKVFRELLGWSDIIILVHPYLLNMVRHMKEKKILIYHALDIEYIQKLPILKDTEFLNDVKDAEQLACEIADQIWLPSQGDFEQLGRFYNFDRSKVRIVPNGIELSHTPFIPRQARAVRKAKIKGLDSKTVCLFSATAHPPNLEAVDFIINDLSPMNKNIVYFIVGSVKDFFLNVHPNLRIPENVFLFDTLLGHERIELYHLVDLALNPMFSGSGVNIKMLAYMAYGHPIVTTRHGARGLEICRETPLCDKYNFYSEVVSLANDMARQEIISIKNREIVEMKYSYATIALAARRNILDLIYSSESPIYGLLEKLSEEIRRMGVDQSCEITSKLAQEVHNMNTI